MHLSGILYERLENYEFVERWLSSQPGDTNYRLLHLIEQDIAKTKLHIKVSEMGVIEFDNLLKQLDKRCTCSE